MSKRSQAEYEEQIKNCMKILQLTGEEAIQLLEEDEEIDKMKLKNVNDDLTGEQKKIVKKCKNVDSHKRVDAYGKEKTVKRKPKEDLRELVKSLSDLLGRAVAVDEVVITNPEHQIEFLLNGKLTKIVISQSRGKR